MSSSLAIRNLLILAGLGVGAQAHARAVLLAPLLPAKGVPEERVTDIKSIMSSELEFMEGVDEVIELDEPPASLTLSCLDSTSCLGTIAEQNEADVFLAGAITKSGEDYLIDLLFYDADINRVLRRKTYTLTGGSSTLLDQVSPMVAETFTGVSPSKKAAEAKMSGVDFDPEDDEMKFDPKATGNTAPAPAPAPTPVAQPPAEEFDPNAFSFDTTATQITFTDTPTITFDEEPPSPEPAPAVDDDPSPPPSRYAEDPIVDDEPEDEEEEEPIRRTADEDRTPSRDDDRGRSSTSSRSSSTTRSGGRDLDEFGRATITTRGGYTHYGLFNFGTIGAEIGIRAVAGLSIVAGIDLHIVNRALPPEEAEARGKAVETNFIFPLNAGLLYRFKAGRVQPYIGADAIFSHLRTECIDLSNDGCVTFADPSTRGTVTQGVDYVLKQHWAVGGRGRLGLDVMLSPNIGFNADVALGYWQSNDWPNVDPRQPTSGFLPHVGAGLVFAF
jgi:hypothetical protein